MFCVLKLLYNRTVFYCKGIRDIQNITFLGTPKIRLFGIMEDF